MPKRSAGVLLYRRARDELEVLIVHPGGPFWTKKDDGAWSIPKGEYDETEDPWVCACREFTEELGHPSPTGEPIDLGELRQAGGKRVRCYALEGDLDVDGIVSNTFEMEWPPRSGRTETFPEIDRATWVSAEVARQKLNKTQAGFVDLLLDAL